MKVFRNGLYWISVILLLICIGWLLWYALAGSQHPSPEQNGTLVLGMPTEHVEMETERRVTS